jgi:hypothetical protein
VINIFYTIKFILFSKKKINLLKENSNIILLEIYNFKSAIISLFYFAFTLARLKRATIVCYFPIFINYKIKILAYLSPVFFLSYFKIYSTFSFRKVIFPKKILSNFFVSGITKRILKKINSKKSLESLKISGVLIGDLIYDTYLRDNDLATIEIKSERFKSYLSKIIHLFYFWDTYLNNKRIKGIIISHSVYLMGMVGRIAMNKNIDTYQVGSNATYKLTKNKYIRWSDQGSYKRNFNKLSNTHKKKAILSAKKNLDLRFKGKKDFRYLVSQPIEPVFNKHFEYKKIAIKQNNNTKILIAAHCFNDAIHVYGNNLFPDFYEWLKFLGEFSLKSKNNYDWYIKIHPAHYDANINKFNFFLKKYPKFNLIEKYVSANQIIKENIDIVLTVFGSVAHEYPLFGIPVINAGNNPHSGFKFSYNPKNVKDYLSLLKKIPKIKCKINERDIYVFYYMHHLIDYNFYKNFIINDSSLKVMNTHGIFKIFMNQINQKKNNQLIGVYEKFIIQKKRRLIKI